MADYKELLRRAVEALPENNGAARRAVYEKARAALVGQLRAINPPLAARDITAHRLQLEDCIRQVEQEASEAVIAGLGSGKEDNPPPPPVYFEPPAKKAAPAVARPVAKATPAPVKEPPKPLPPGGTIEEIIAAANAEQTQPQADQSRQIVRADAKPMGKPVPKLVPSSRPQIAAPVIHAAHAEDEVEEEAPRAPIRPNGGGRPLPSIVARAEAAKSRTGNAAFGAPIGGPARGPVLEPRRDIAAPRLEPAARNGQAATARQLESDPVALFEETPIAAAMSAVREVEVEPAPADPQGAIDRAIATLDREARGDADLDEGLNAFDTEDDGDEEPAHVNGFAPSVLKADAPSRPLQGKTAKATDFARDARAPRKREAEPRIPRARQEDDRRGLGAVTIFLIVFAVLLVGAGGAGFWAWREGFIDLDAMFGRAPTTEQVATAPATPAETPAEAPATGPGNTNTPAETAAPKAELERLGADPAAAAAPAAETAALPLVEPSSEQRLGAEPTPAAAATAEQAVAAVDPANLAGSQSLLLEASDSGTTGAVPFSGTVEWSQGTDEMGLPTLVGKASIPARNLAVDVLIRKNSDSSLPASHLMEVNFRVTDSFIGGSIAGLPGVLLKNEELVQGTPLVGASARVVGNSFLFALSATPADITANSALLTSRKWMDLALIYATGKRAIITLEKDATAEKMFADVVAEWNKQVAAQAN